MSRIAFSSKTVDKNFGCVSYISVEGRCSEAQLQDHLKAFTHQWFQMTTLAFCCAPSQFQACGKARVCSLQLSSASNFQREIQRTRKVSRRPIHHETFACTGIVAQHTHKPAATSHDPHRKPRHAGTGRGFRDGQGRLFEGMSRFWGTR